MTSKKVILATVLLVLLAFILPIEHKYDRPFRHYSLTLIPEGLTVSKQYGKKIYFYISDLIAIALTFLGLAWFRIPLKKWLGNPLWLVWLFALLSIIVSPFYNYPIPYIRLLQLFTPIALVAFIANVKEDFTSAILHSLVLAALFQTGIAICQYFNQAPLGLRLIGEVSDMSFFFMPDKTRWLIDSLFGLYQNKELIIRASGTFSHANVLGAFLVLSILATCHLATSKRAWLIALPFQFMALAVSFSRAALFAWAIATFLWVCLSVYHFGVRRLIPTLGVILISFGTMSALFYNQYVQRGGVVNYNSWVTHSDNVRKIQQKTGVEIFKDHLFFGVGFSQFSERSAHYFKEGNVPNYAQVTAPHNIFLFLACETGIFALFAFLLFLGAAFWKFVREPKTERSILFFSLLVSFIFIGFCDFHPILFQPGKLMFFLIAALLVANTRKSVISSLGYEGPISRTRLENV